ncbi:MAG: hypothetical protein IJ716_03015 [Lachnospiraceae bacterium]|nr:hypothetical protein [Lachnospiraceae bacterium]
MKKEYKKYWICGIVGAVCFGIGDWLLGYVDPGIVDESFSVIKVGHGAGYDLVKITITLLFGAMGVPFLMLGCMKMADILTEDSKKKGFRFLMAQLPVGWLIIHFTVSVFIYAYSWSIQNGMAETAEKLAADIQHMMQPAQIVSYLFIGLPLVLLIVYVLRGKTALQKRSQFFTPLLWMALLSGLKFVIPASPFSNGIDTFCMNAALIIWFVYLMTVKEEQ